MKFKIIAAGLALFTIGFYSCVPANKLTEEQNKRKDAEAQLAAAKAADDACETKKTELQAKLDLLQNQVTGLQQDSTSCGSKYRETEGKYDKLNQLNEELLAKYNDLLSGNDNDHKK